MIPPHPGVTGIGDLEMLEEIRKFWAVYYQERFPPPQTMECLRCGRDVPIGAHECL